MINYFTKYTFLQLFFIALQIAIGKLFISHTIRIVKLPFSIIGKHNISLGTKFTAGKNLRIECFSQNHDKTLFIGNNVKMNDYVHIACVKHISIGDNVLIGSNVLITDHLHGRYTGEWQDTPYTIPDERQLYAQAVIIEDNTWIGDMVSIMPNVTIGSGSIIGANSVVTTNIPKNCIAVGNPCKVIKRFNDETQQWDRVQENEEH
jgi:lipopolysaccharide O-acetyltransferase